MSAIVARLKEPSTWAGIAAFVAGASFIPHAAEVSQMIVGAGMVVAAALAIFLPEQKS
jgi:hypothetical protein